MKIISRNSVLYHFLAPVKQSFRLAKHKAQWRAGNAHNMTKAKNIFPIDRVKVGKGTYGEIEYYYFGNPSEGLTIGNYCSIAGSVKFLGGGQHPVNQLSTYPFARFVYGLDGGKEDTKGPIKVGDDVWICDGVTILSGVTIGQGAVIGANSIVTKDVPPYAIWMGTGIKRYRFTKEICTKLATLDYNDINYIKFKEYCTKELSEDNIDEILSKINER